MYGIDKNILISYIKDALGDLYTGSYVGPYEVRPLESNIDYQFYLRDTSGVNYDIIDQGKNNPFYLVQNYTLVVTYTTKVNIDNIITNTLNALFKFGAIVKNLTTDQNLIANTELRNKEQKNYTQPMLRINFSTKSAYMINYKCSQTICEKC